jgi:iron complex outermembrane receptor protein
MNRPNNALGRKALLAAAISSLAFVPALAFANEIQDETNVDEGDAIVVSGIRSSLDNAMASKRQAASVIDVISSEDIGQYPDVNVAESIQRVSGVQISRVRGEGQSVSIRGLPAEFSLATLNGRGVANAMANADASASRAFDFTILPPEFIRALEVYKAPTADLEEGGLSGTVNIRTPRALEIGKRVLTAAIQGEFEGNSGKVSPRASALFADTFADGRLGVTLGVSYSKRRPETHSMSLGYNFQTEGTGLASGGLAADLNGDGVIQNDLGVRVPTTLFNFNFKEQRERIAAIANVEYEVSDNLTLYVDGLYSKLSVEAIRNENLAYLGNSGGLVSAGTESQILEGHPTVTRLELTSLDQRGNGRFEDRSGYLYTITAGGRWDNHDGWSANLEGTFSRSQQDRNHLTIATMARGTGYFSAGVGDELPSIVHTGDFAEGWKDPSNYNVNSINGEFLRKSTDRIFDARFNVKREFDQGLLSAISFGGRFASRDQFQNNGRLTIGAAGVSSLYGGLPVGTTAGTVSAAPLMTLITPGRGGYMDSYTGSAIFPSEFWASDTRGLIAGKSNAELIAAGSYTDDATGIIDVSERTLAGYVRGDFETGRLSGNAGLRVIHTWQSSVGVSPDLYGITLQPDAGGITRVPNAAPISVSNEYTDFLPSLNLKFEANDNLTLRFGASRTMARPNLGDISPTTTANGISRIITQKNPYLAPFRANNLDLTAEYYFAKGAMVGVSAFYKDIKSLIRNETTTETYPVQVIYANGDTQIADMSFTVNRIVNGKGVKVKGFEVYYQQPFTFLPAPFDGFGASANYTFIDNSDPQQLTAASRHNFNVTGYYEKGPVGVRLSYAWRGSYLSTAGTATVMGVETQAYGSLDGSASLKVTPNVTLSLEAVNLLNSAQKASYTTGLPSNYIDSGRRILFGARASF